MWSDLSKGNNQEMSAHNVFDEMARSKVEEWRSPNRILEVTIHKVCYPITEYVLHQIFGRFGKVENVYVCTGVERVEANVVFQSKLEAAEAYGELHGRNIYNDCCRMEIKWGCHNTPKSLCAQAAPKVPPTAPATSSMTTAVNPGSEHATAQHVSTEDDTTSFTLARCLTDFFSHDIIVPKPISAASTSTLVPAAPSAEDEGISVSTKLTATTTELFLTSTTPSFPTTAAAPTSISAPATSPTSVDSSLYSNNGCSSECSQLRYTTNSTPSYLFGVVLPCKGTKIRDGQVVFERLLVQSPVLLEPLNGTMVDTRFFPPKQHCNIFPSETIQLYFSLWAPFSRDWITVWQSPPWPPPRQLDMQCAGVHLRPTPWPSFGCHTVGQLEKALSHSWHMVQFGPESSPVLVDIAIPIAKLFWLVITCYHERVQLKISWMYLLYINFIGCYAASSIIIWTYAIAMRSLACLVGDTLVVSVTTRMFLLFPCYRNGVKFLIFSGNVLFSIGKSNRSWKGENLDQGFSAELYVICTEQLVRKPFLQNSVQRVALWYLQYRVKPQHKVGDGLLFSIIRKQQVILWDPGGGSLFMFGLDISKMISARGDQYFSDGCTIDYLVDHVPHPTTAPVILVGVSGMSCCGSAAVLLAYQFDLVWALVQSLIQFDWSTHGQLGPHMLMLITSALSCSHILLPEVPRVVVIQIQYYADGSMEKPDLVVQIPAPCNISNMVRNSWTLVVLIQELLFEVLKTRLPVTWSSPTSLDSSPGTDQQSYKAPDDPWATYDRSMQVRRVKGLLTAYSYVVIKINNVTSIRYLQAPWDPGGMDIRYRLGGKPILKKGGMLGSQYI